MGETPALSARTGVRAGVEGEQLSRHGWRNKPQFVVDSADVGETHVLSAQTGVWAGGERIITATPGMAMMNLSSKLIVPTWVRRMRRTPEQEFGPVADG